MKIETDKLVQVFHEDESGMRELRGTFGEGQPLVEIPLVAVGPQRVLCEGEVFELDHPGLYRFSIAPCAMQNVIVHDPNSPLPLLRALASLQIHGNRHEGDGDATMLRLLREDSCLSVTCGTIARLGRALLERQGYQCRFVAGLTLEKWNAYDNGHTLLEVLWPEAGWVLADLDMGLLFRESDRLLSLHGVWQCVRDNRMPEMEKLAAARVDPHFYMDGYNLALIREWSWRSPEAIWEWYRRVFQTVAVLQPEEGYVYFGPENRLREYCASDMKILDEAGWTEKFYS